MAIGFASFGTVTAVDAAGNAWIGTTGAPTLVDKDTGSVIMSVDDDDLVGNLANRGQRGLKGCFLVAHDHGDRKKFAGLFWVGHGSGPSLHGEVECASIAAEPRGREV